MSRSLENLRAVEKHFELKQDERGLILNALSPLPYPSLHQATEMFLTHTHLFTATYLCNATLCANSNCEVPNYLYTSNLTKSLQKVLLDFRVYGIIAQKFSDATITKILREDKCELYPFHLDHPDFVKLVFSMRLALAKNVRMLIKDQLYNEIHSKLFVLGITNDMEKSNMYALHCKVSTTFALKADLVPNTKDVEQYLKTISPLSMAPSTSRKKTDQPNTAILNLDYHLTSQITKGVSNTTVELWLGEIVANSQTWKIFHKTCKHRNELNTFFALSSNENTVITLAGTVIEHMTSRDEIIKALCDLIVQVAMLEQKQVIHNDIKPSNIVEYRSHYYLIDYGIATRFSSCTDGKYYDKHGQEVICKSGTPGYNAPEREENFIVSPKSDICSLGLSM
ncbi:hypothetical protein C9374_008290 [Naegleria lovaniensis]|uniref:non-specific serine/threonine protein kinase n=1 Tax=Naegleria lovaniensis TaxID=51637 RepID=A0AA88GLE2_NAELO|nr:uncharacterized protein C9374_008290 [Naegleria lovaniensis]KAG2378651.1 hypothetical protein C9374_008290 [Naegleria lovaniensis]